MSSWGFGHSWGRRRSREFVSTPFWNVHGFPGLSRGLWMYPPEVLTRLQGPSASPLSQPALSNQTVGPERSPGVMPPMLGPIDPSMSSKTKEQEIERLRQQLDFFPQLGAMPSSFGVLGPPVPALTTLPPMLTLPTLPKEQKIQLLKQQAQFLRQQLENITKQLNELTRES